MKIARRTVHTPAFWERLVQHGIRPEDVAQYVHGYSELEVTAEMTFARIRLDDAQQERQLRRRLFASDAPSAMHDRTISISRIWR